MGVNKDALIGLATRHLSSFSRLGSSMVSPIVKFADYNSLLRKVTIFEPISEGQMAYWDSDKEGTFSMLTWDGNRKLKEYVADRVYVEPFDVVVKGVRKDWRELRKRKHTFAIIGELKEELKVKWCREENTVLVDFLTQCTTHSLDKRIAKEVSVHYIQRFINRMRRRRWSRHFVLITTGMFKVMDKEFLIELMGDRMQYVIIKVEKEAPYCWIIEEKAIWAPCYCMADVFPYIENVDDKTGLIQDGKVGFNVNGLMGIALNITEYSNRLFVLK